MPIISKDFWLRIDEDFKGSELIVGQLSVASERDVRQYRAALKTKGEFAQADLFELGLKLKPMNQKIIKEFYSVFHDLGIHIPSEIENPLPDFIQPNDLPAKEIVIKALAAKQLTPEFLEAWGRYKQALGVFIMLMNDQNIEDHFRRNIQKNLPNIIEQHIYAYWIDYHVTRGVLKRSDADQQLADKIDCLPSSGFPKQEFVALRNMLEDGSRGLKFTYRSMAMAQINQIVSEKIILLNDLLFLKKFAPEASEVPDL